MGVRIVTGGTSDIPGDAAQRLGISVVARNVHFGAETVKDNVTVTPDEFYRTLADGPEPTKTSQAAPGEFMEVYNSLGEGAEGIVSIHISS